MVNLPAAQGTIATGKGAKYARQIVGPEVEFVKKHDSLVPFYKMTRPEKDKKLHRPGYTNNVSVLIDLHGQEFQFKAPLVIQPRATDIDIAHTVLDTIRDGARAGGEFVKEMKKGPSDEIAFLIRRQAQERALSELNKKELAMLREGLSPEEVANLTAGEFERILRKYEMATPMEQLVEQVRMFRGAQPPDDGGAGAGVGVGVSALRDGPRTMPALSVPFMFHRGGADAGVQDSMGRTRATGAPSQGFVANRAPATGATLTRQFTTEGQPRAGFRVRGAIITTVGMRAADLVQPSAGAPARGRFTVAEMAARAATLARPAVARAGLSPLKSIKKD